MSASVANSQPTDLLDFLFDQQDGILSDQMVGLPDVSKTGLGDLPALNLVSGATDGMATGNSWVTIHPRVDHVDCTLSIPVVIEK